MLRSLALSLLCATMVSGIKIKDTPEKLNEQTQEQSLDEGKKSYGYAYVTMWVSSKYAPNHMKKTSLMTPQESKFAFKVVQKEEGLDEASMKTKHMAVDLEQKLGGAEAAYMGTLKLAQQLQKTGSKYPMVVLTNEPKLLELQINETKMASYPNVVIKPIKDEDWLKPNCKLKDGNGMHYQKLSVWGLTEYEKLIWIDTDVTIRKNLDSVFTDPEYDLKDGDAIYGQLDDYMCDNHGDFCSGVMLFQPKKEHVDGLVQAAKKMEWCWGDQRIMRKYFKEKPRALKTFSHKVVSWGHCPHNKADPMAVHNQRPNNVPLR